MKAIYILGNGPSLNGQVDMLPKIRRFDTFACNRFYQWSHAFPTTYFACSANAILRNVEPIDPPYAKKRFLVSRRMDQLAQFDNSWVKVYKKEWHAFLNGGNSEPLPVRGVVTMPGIMAQLAVNMGFDHLFLLGIEQRGSGHQFDPEGKKMPYFIPDENVLFANWQGLKDTYEAMGITLRDCTPGGRLNDILGYSSLEEVLDGRYS